jgi:hypothetical protein
MKSITQSPKIFSLFILILILLLSLSCATLHRQRVFGASYYTPNLGTEVIYDCDLSLNEALARVPEECPGYVLKNLALVEVYYFSFDQKVHRGQLLLDYRLAEDAQKVFKVILETRFPVYGVIPLDHSSYDWSDFKTSPEGNTYSFHYRKIAFKKTLSYHSYGQAIDINPLLNPFRKWGVTFPPGGTYNPEEPGTLYKDHPIVKEFEKLGWFWGGDWRRRDFQHFQKPLKGALDIHIAKNPKQVPWPYKGNFEDYETEKQLTRR